MAESAYERARRMSGGEGNWGDHVNSTRKDSCFDCGEFHEPEDLTWHEDAEDYVCPTCFAARDKDAMEAERRFTSGEHRSF